MSWKDSENSAYKYLKNKIKSWVVENKLFSNFRIEHKGGSDSTSTDLELYKNTKLLFNLEIKMSKSQIGQFVIMPDPKKKVFILSSKNKGEKKRTQKIHKHMNQNFDYYKNPGKKSGIELICQKKLLYECIQGYFTEKKIIFLIISTSKDNKIVYYKNFKNFFDITGKYRVKKSGSRSVPLKLHLPIIKYLNNKFSLSNEDFKISCNKIYVNNNSKINKIDKVSLNNIKEFELNNLKNFKFYFSDPKDNLIEIRTLSNTNNPNVIFEISLKKDIVYDNEKLFKKILLDKYD